MANFNTHMITGAAICGTTGIIALSGGLADPKEVLLLFGVGSLGGILPDIDSDNSVVIQFVFSALSVLGAFGTIFRMGIAFSVAELLLGGLAVFLMIYFGLAPLFKAQTVHRGVFHSIPAALLFGILTVTVFFHGYRTPATLAWLGGIFMTTGYLTHLVLDEIYSVDLTNKRIKRSFGSALKFFDRGNPLGSMLLYFFAFLLPAFLPGPDNLVHQLGQPEIRRNLEEKLFPEDRSWFVPPFREDR